LLREPVENLKVLLDHSSRSVGDLLPLEVL